MFEVSFDGKVAFVKELDNSRCMIAVQLIGVNVKDMDGNKGKLRLYINVFFPSTFRGVTELEAPQAVRISGRVTAIEELPDPKGKGATVIRISIHGYSITKALRDSSIDVARELGAA